MTQFLRFIVVGVFNTVFGYCLIFGFMYLAHMSPEASNMAGYAIAILVSFILNKHYIFARGHDGSAMQNRGALLRFLGVFAVSYAANYAMLIALIYKLDLHAGLSQIVAGAVYVTISFLLNKYYVFKFS